jgi:tungstate transport system permease protein
MGGSVGTALTLIWEGDPELLGILRRSLVFALSSTALAGLIGLPLAGLLTRRRFPGRRVILTFFNAFMALPTVVVALALYGLISRSGPLGYLGLLFSPAAVIVGQTVLILPIVVSLASAAMGQADPRLTETVRSLGGGRLRSLETLVREQLPAILAAILGGFGRAIGEVGVSMMLGGNIRHYTRSMTTAIALETNRGAFELAVALGIVLIVVALGVNGGLRMLTELGGRQRRRSYRVEPTWGR